MHKRGFVFIIEAMLALAFFTLFIITSNHYAPQTLAELALIQQEDDLLRVWSAAPSNSAAMQTDTTTLFGDNVTLMVDSQILLQGKTSEHCTSTTGTIVGQDLVEQKVIITVCT